MTSVSFAPLLPLPVIYALAAMAVVAALAAIWVRRATGLARAVALVLMALALANPTLVNEERERVKDIVAVVVDRSGSQALGDRAAQTQAALTDVVRRIGELPDLEARVIELPENDGAEGTRLFAAMSQGLADVPSGRLAGAIMITDGIVHDVPQQVAALGFRAPVHALVTGHAAERDRRVVLVDGPRFGLVGKELVLRVRVEERGGTGRGRLTIRRDGQVVGTIDARPGAPIGLQVRIDRAGANVFEIEVDGLDGELTTANNRIVHTVEGVREKLRVLLVSGEPHSGERTWRNLLKSDANVDLVHFTILRPPEKQDGTPINELSLIAFPTRELFQVKIREFDLIILDRYANQSILPSIYYENIARYVRDGGALLVAAGPEFSGLNSLARTPLAAVLPAQPDGQVLEQPFRARVTDQGVRHPVTRDLPGSASEPPAWGEWLRVVGSRSSRGTAVMSGPGDRPLLLLNRENKGRVALLLSDHAWLWARGFQDGGPHLDLLRRLGHWLMKEPDLEEEALRAYSRGRDVEIERQTMSERVDPAVLRLPSGREVQVPLSEARPGVFTGSAPSGELGLHRVDQGNLTTFVGIGPANPREMADVFSDSARLQPLMEATGGSVRRIGAEGHARVNMPRIVALRAGTTFSGGDWIGMRPTDSARIVGLSLLPLMLGGLGLLLLALPAVFAWLSEAGRLRRADRR